MVYTLIEMTLLSGSILSKELIDPEHMYVVVSIIHDNYF